nr:hypothetical protein [Tanacetum cinerariifolium]
TIIHHRCHLRQPAPIHQPPPLQRHHTAIPSSLNHHTTQPATSRRSTVAGTTTPPPLPLDTINSRCLAAKAAAAASTAGSQPADSDDGTATIAAPCGVGLVVVIPHLRAFGCAFNGSPTGAFGSLFNSLIGAFGYYY